jgi:hypothetical protein
VNYPIFMEWLRQNHPKYSEEFKTGARQGWDARQQEIDDLKERVNRMAEIITHKMTEVEESPWNR